MKVKLVGRAYLHRHVRDKNGKAVRKLEFERDREYDIVKDDEFAAIEAVLGKELVEVVDEQPGEDDETTDLTKLTKAQIIDHATSAGLKVPEELASLKKPDLITAVNELLEKQLAENPAGD